MQATQPSSSSQVQRQVLRFEDVNHENKSPIKDVQSNPSSKTSPFDVDITFLPSLKDIQGQQSCEQDIIFLPSLRDGALNDNLHRYDNVPLLDQMVYWGDYDAEYLKALQRPQKPTIGTQREQDVSQGKVETQCIPAESNVFVPHY